MSSGKVHDRVNSYVTLAVITSGIAAKDYNTTVIGIGIAIGTIWLSPDLDIKHSLPSKRLWVLNPLFLPYRRFCGHHRGFRSHSPIFSSLIRVAYCCLPFTLEILKWDELPRWAIPVLIGLEISTLIHIALDIQYSIRKGTLHW